MQDKIGAEMYYDNPNKLPPAVIRPFYKVAEKDTANNDFAKTAQQHPGPEDFGGHFAVSTSGSVASSATVSTQLHFVPWNYPNPSWVQELNHKGDLMSLEEEIRKKI